MELGNLKKVIAPKAAPIVAGASIEEDVAPLLEDDPDPRTLLQRLVENEQPLEAARFLILALPQREVIWLGCLAARFAAESRPLSQPDERALVAAEKWVFEPSEENRRAAELALEGLDYSTPAALAAMAVFYSGGNIADDETAELMAPDGVSTKLIDAATALVSVDEDLDQMQLRARRLLAQAIDVADGGSGRDVKF